MNRVLVILSAFFVLLSNLTAQSLSEEQIRAKIQDAVAGIKTIQCDFVQTKKMKMLADIAISKGRMCSEQNTKLRWEYTDPQKHIFIFNENKVLLDNGTTKEVIDIQQSKVFKEVAKLMKDDALLKGLNGDKDFEIKFSSDGNVLIADMVPVKRQLKHLFTAITLHVSADKNIISSVEIKGQNGETTLIEFNNVQINKNIDSTHFSVNN